MGTGDKMLGDNLRWTSVPSRGVAIHVLLVASCYRNRDNLRQLWATRIVKTLPYTYMYHIYYMYTEGKAKSAASQFLQHEVTRSIVILSGWDASPITSYILPNMIHRSVFALRSNKIFFRDRPFHFILPSVDKFCFAELTMQCTNTHPPSAYSISIISVPSTSKLSQQLMIFGCRLSFARTLA